MRTRVRISLIIAACCSLSVTGAAEDLDFETAVGDLNGDGVREVFVRARSRIVPILVEGDIIPVPVRPPGSRRFVLIQQPSGGFATEFIELER